MKRMAIYLLLAAVFALTPMTERKANCGSTPDLTTVYNLQQQVADLEEQNKRLAEKRVIKATVTAYTPRKQECDSDPTITAFMTNVRPGTVAISHDLLDKGWAPGMKVYIKGFGVFVINDLMNKRFTKRFDIFTHDLKHARKIGKNTNITVALLG